MQVGPNLELIFWVFVLGSYPLGYLGVDLAYHRILTHQAAKLNKWILYPLVIIGLSAGTPLQWVGNHRYHHKHADTEKDLHSPVHKGFWVAHSGWYLNPSSLLISVMYSFAGPLRILFDAFYRPRTNQQHNNLAGDIKNRAFLNWVSRCLPYALCMLTFHGSTWWVKKSFK